MSTLRRFLIAALALLGSAGLAEALELRLADVEIASGATAGMTIRARDAKGLGALQMKLTFDGAAVEIIGVAAGPILSNALVDFKPGKNDCAIALASSEPVEADGDLLVLTIRRIGSSGAATEIAPKDVRAWAVADGKTLDVSAAPGHVLAANAPGGFDWRYAVAAGLAALLGLGLGLVYRNRRRGAAGIAGGASKQRPPAKFCSSCGAHLPPESSFCPKCGARIGHGPP